MDMDFNRSKKQARQISLVPLINVVFLLLIFFLVAGTVEKVDVIDVQLPEAQSGEVIEEGPIEILLGRYDEVIVNDQLIELAEVSAWLEPKLERNPDRVITIKADARLKAIRMIDLLDRLKQAGAKQISLTTQES